MSLHPLVSKEARRRTILESSAIFVAFANVCSHSVNAKLWPEIQKLWLKDMPWMSIMWLPTVSGIRSNVCDVPVNALGWYQFQDTWLSTP